MIKFLLKNGSDPEEEFKGTLYLQQRENSDVKLLMSENGYVWEIIHLTTEGTIERCDSLPDDIGLQVDENGKIELSGE